MLKTKLLLIILCVSQNLTYSQQGVFYTYSTTSSQKHELALSEEILTIKRLYRHDLEPEYTLNFKYTKSKDTIFIQCSNTDCESSINSILNKCFIPKKEDKRFIVIKSENELFLPEFNRPYFKKEFIDSLIGKNTIYSINGKIYKSVKDSVALKMITSSLKLRKRNIKILKGKEAYEKYGAIGLNGIIQIKGKRKKSEKK